MRVRGSSTFEEAILIWLRSEWHGIEWDKFPFNEESLVYLIQTPDLGSQQENDERLRLLLAWRYPILVQAHPDGSDVLALARDAPVLKVLIEESDLPQLSIIPSDDWYHDTGGTFRLMDTIQNCGPGGAHYTKVQAKSIYRRDHADSVVDEALILVAPSQTGPFTIIDGNNRAVSLYTSSDETSNLPWRAILICDPRIADYRWFINSPMAQQFLHLWASQPPPKP